MKFERLLEIVGGEAVFETGLLLAGEADPVDVRRQLSRWVRAGKVYQLRRGLYALAPPFQKVKPHPFLIANHMVRGSYVSGESALAFYGLIPEYTPLTISVTSRRPAVWQTPLGEYQFRHIKPAAFTGYELVELPEGQQAFMASPEKALLDLVHLTPGGDRQDYLRGLRLQNLARLDLGCLQSLADQFDRPKLKRASMHIAELARAEQMEYQPL